MQTGCFEVVRIIFIRTVLQENFQNRSFCCKNELSFFLLKLWFEIMERIVSQIFTVQLLGLSFSPPFFSKDYIQLFLSQSLFFVK